MLKSILIVAAVAIVGFLAYAATRPDTFAFERSTVVAAPPDKIFPLIDDLHEFNRWNPFSRKDPQLTAAYSGPRSGPGASYAWDGNSDVGQGRMTVASTQPPGKLVMDLEFIKPMAAKNTVEFTLQPAAGGTRVTWAMHGPAPYITKLMDTVVGMDRMVGPDFERGLASLKSIAEGKP